MAWKRQRFAIAAGFAFGLAFLLVVFFGYPASTFGGVSLKQILNKLSKNPQDERAAQILHEKRSQIMPEVLQLLQKSDSKTVASFHERLNRFEWIGRHWWSGVESRLKARIAIEVLGTNAAPWIPALTKLGRDPSLAYEVASVLRSIGPPARPAILEGLSNPSLAIRSAFERGAGTYWHSLTSVQSKSAPGLLVEFRGFLYYQKAYQQEFIELWPGGCPMWLPGEMDEFLFTKDLGHDGVSEIWVGNLKCPIRKFCEGEFFINSTPVISPEKTRLIHAVRPLTRVAGDHFEISLIDAGNPSKTLTKTLWTGTGKTISGLCFLSNSQVAFEAGEEKHEIVIEEPKGVGSLFQ